MRKKMINLKITSLAIFVMLLTIGATSDNQAKGQGEGNINKPTQEELDAKKQNNQDKKDEAAEKRCENIEAKIEAQIKRFEANQQNRKRAYQEIENKLENLVSNFKKQGFDTIDLEEALVGFRTKLQNFYTEHERLMTQLKNTQNYACEESEGQFREGLKNARQQLRNAHQERLELRNQFVNEIRPALLELRNQIQNKNNPINENNEEAENNEL